jgi:hypothetical protein
MSKRLSPAVLDAKMASLERSSARLDRKLGVAPRKPDPCLGCQHYSRPDPECRNCYRAVHADRLKLRRRVLALERKLKAAK